jgi:hypothetical protein
MISWKRGWYSALSKDKKEQVHKEKNRETIILFPRIILSPSYVSCVYHKIWNVVCYNWCCSFFVHVRLL